MLLYIPKGKGSNLSIVPTITVKNIRKLLPCTQDRLEQVFFSGKEKDKKEMLRYGARLWKLMQGQVAKGHIRVVSSFVSKQVLISPTEMKTVTVERKTYYADTIDQHNNGVGEDRTNQAI